jgi:hypothetical protein
MTLHGVMIINLAGLALMVMIINLVRTHRLYVGYAAIWLFSTAVLLLTVTVPWLLDAVTKAVGAVFPASALTLLALIFIIVVLIFFSVKLTTLSERQTELIQAFALKELLAKERDFDEASKVRPSQVSDPTSLDH